MIKCDTCGKDIVPGEILIIWNETAKDEVTGLGLVHKSKPCDDRGFNRSAGAAYGPDWSVEEERERFTKKTFRDVRDERKLNSALNFVEEMRSQKTVVKI